MNDPLNTYRDALETELRECLEGREGFLFDLLRYHLGWADQHGNPEQPEPRESFHALVAPAVCQALTGGFAASMPVAAAVELVYNFSLVHGDVQAGRVDAHSRPSIWWVWGPAQAINAGDGFHAMARMAMMRLGDLGIPPEGVLAATELLDRSCLAMCEGQFSDLGFQDRMLVTMREYSDMISLKAGALTACAAAGGVLAAGNDNTRAGRFQEAGRMLGMAWQVSRDIAEFWGREGDGFTASNVLNKKKSLPLIYCLENATTAAKREIGSIYMKRVLEPQDMSRIIEIMDGTGARGYSQAHACQLAAEGLAAMEENLPPGGDPTGLRLLADLATGYG